MNVKDENQFLCFAGSTDQYLRLKKAADEAASEVNYLMKQLDPTRLDSDGKTVALHADFRDKKGDLLWKLTSIDKAHWNVNDLAQAKEILRGYPDHSIRKLYINTHCGGSLAAQLLLDAEYQALLRQKLSEKNPEIYVYSCTQGNREEERNLYQQTANTIGAVIHAPTGTSTTPWGGFGIVREGTWIKYTPGAKVPYEGKGVMRKNVGRRDRKKMG